MDESVNKRVMSIYIVFLVLLLICSGGSIAAESHHADGSIRVGAFIDTGAADALISDHLYLHGGAALKIADGFSIDLPVTAVFNRGESSPGEYILLDIGMLLKYYPASIGLWAGISIFQGVSFIGDEIPDQQHHYMTEFAVGYTFHLPDGFYIEPSVVIRDPLNTFHDSMEYIENLLPGYSDFRICLNLGWLFWSVG